MLSIQVLSLTFHSLSNLPQNTNQDCYLILSHNQNKYYTKPAHPISTTFTFKFQQEQIKVNKKNPSLITIKMVHYDTYKVVVQYDFDISEEKIIGNGHKYQAFVGKKEQECKVQIRFKGEEKLMGSRLDKVSSLERSKRTSTTTNHEEQSISILQKVQSLKHIVRHQRDLLSLSTSQSPKHAAELSYLRSFRQNLQKKLFRSIQMTSKPKRSLIV